MKTSIRALHVFCGPFPTPQGTQTLVKQTCTLLATQNVETHLLCYHHNASPKIQLPFTVHRISNLPQFDSERSGPAFPKIPLDISIAITLRKLIRKLKPHVVHAHHYEALAACVFAAVADNTPLIFQQHATFEPELPMYAPQPFARPLTALGRAIDTYFPKFADHIICISPQNARQLNARKNHRPITVAIPPATDTPARIDTNQTSDIVTAVYTGNLDKYQNIDSLLKAIIMLPSRIRRQFKLKLITASSPLSIQSRLAQCGTSVNVISHGSFEDVWRHLCTADIGIVPRVCLGGVPIKLINTYAAGTPVMVNPDLMPELNSQEALLVDTSQPSEIAAAIEQLVSSAPLRNTLRTNAAHTSLRLFSPTAYTKAIIDTYSKCLELQLT